MNMELSILAQRYQALYQAGRVRAAGLARAVALGLITQAEADAILTDSSAGA